MSRAIRGFASVAAGALALGVLTGCRTMGSGPLDPILAEVDGDPIRFSDAEQFFESRHQNHLSLLAGSRELDRLVEKIITHRLLVREAYALELDREPEIERVLEAERARLRRKELFAREVRLDREIGEDEVDTFHARSANRYWLGHILARTRAEAEELHRRIEEGEAFEDLAREHSIAASAVEGGHEPPVEMPRVPARVLEALGGVAEGQVTEPIPEKDGWSLYRLESLEVVAPKPLDDARRAYFRELLLSRRENRREEAFVAALVVEEGEWIDEDLLARLAREGLTEPGPAAEKGTGQRALPVSAPLARLGDQVLPVEDLRPLATLLLDREPAARRREDYLYEESRGWLRRQAIDQAAAKVTLGLEDEEHLRRIRESVMDAAMRREFVYKMPAPSEEELQRFYDAHAGPFTRPLRVRLEAIFHAKREDAEESLAEIRAGRAFAEVARERSEDPTTSGRGGEVGWVDPGDMLVDLEGPIRDLAAGEMSGIIASSKGFHILRARQRSEPARIPFEAARADVVEACVREKREAALAEWSERLRRRSHVVVFEEGMARALDILEKRGQTLEGGLGHGGPSAAPPQDPGEDVQA